MEWTKTSRFGPTYQLNHGEPDEDGVLCIVRLVDGEYMWSVDNVDAHHLIAHGSEGTLDAAMAAAEHAYSPLFPLSLFAPSAETYNATTHGERYL